MVRLRNVLAMVVALLVLGVSSQAAVCELACGLQVQVAGCRGAGPMVMQGDSAGVAMDHSHCHHAMAAGSTQTIMNHVGDCNHHGGCNHGAVTAFDKGGTQVMAFAAVRWIAVSVIPVELNLPASYVGVGQRVHGASAALDPVMISLRV